MGELSMPLVPPSPKSNFHFSGFSLTKNAFTMVFA
jgi:hypothetical protein